MYGRSSVSPLAQSNLAAMDGSYAEDDEPARGDAAETASGFPAVRRTAVVELIPHARAAAQHHAPAPVLAMAAPGTVALPAPLIPSGVGSVSLLRDLTELFKIKVVLLVVVTGWGGYALGAAATGVSGLQRGLLDALFGIGLVSAGAGALNEVLERRTDALMKRTANRPLAAGRMSLAQGWPAGLGALMIGAFWLYLFVNPFTALLAVLTAFTYAAIYTPLKRRTAWATFIGAFPGAMGPMLGWTAARGRIEWPAAALFAILFVWQFPHFMSIAWLYRGDYARAGIRMLPVVQPDGVSTVVVSLIFAVLMIPVSLTPVLLGLTGPLYAGTALVLGLIYLAATVRFARILRSPTEAQSRAAARELLKTSVLFLPLLFAILMICAHRAR
jgi:protoheme IX farnesyltransferase